jgi:hypothetical protein
MVAQRMGGEALPTETRRDSGMMVGDGREWKRVAPSFFSRQSRVNPTFA